MPLLRTKHQHEREQRRLQQKETKGKLKNLPRTTIDMPPAASTRWCPTPEQLMVLEELYRSGVRTPDAPKIQQITAHLSCYGRIEGKNVFYWFQNHKARERQKLRRRLSMQNHLLCAGYPLPLLQPRPLHLFQDHSAAPLSPLLHHHHYHQEHLEPYNMNTSHFSPQEGLNLLGKLETKEDDQLAALPNIEACGQEWSARMFSQPPPTSTSKPLKTLDLFPTKSSSS